MILYLCSSLFVVFYSSGVVSFIFCLFFGHLGPTWDDNGTWKQQKYPTAQKVMCFWMSFWGLFESLEASACSLIFWCFFHGPFGRHFPDFGRQRGPQGGPSGTILRPLGGTGRNVKLLVSFMRKHDFEVWRGSRETCCETLCVQCFSTHFSERVFLRFVAVLVIKWGPIGDPRGLLFGNLFAYLFKAQFVDGFWGAFGRGRQQGRGLSSMQNIRILGPLLSRLATPCGVRRILRLRPCCRPPVRRQLTSCSRYWNHVFLSQTACREMKTQSNVKIEL